MNYRTPSYGETPPSDAAGVGALPKIAIIVCIVLTVVFVGILAIALGVGLGIGLRKTDSIITKLAAPVVTCDVASTSCGCAGIKPIFSARIINGETATTNSWPWMVYLIMNSTKICTGFLITQRHVLTAASCVRGYGANITVSYGTNSFPSAIGVSNVTATNFTVTNTTADSFDSVAIVTLGINITYSSTVRPCCLSSDPTEPFIKQHAVIAGWGETSTVANNTASPTLQQAVVRVLNPTDCGAASSTYQICAGFRSISACSIDVGAPLMTSANNAWTCVGLVSGLKPNCNNPITFTRIDAYQTFIRNITGLIF